MPRSGGFPAAGTRRQDAAATVPRCTTHCPTPRMAHAQITETVRQLVAETFTELGLADAHEVRETILVRGGAYCGRRFETPDAHAVWFVEENQLKFYCGDGSVARVVMLGGTSQGIARQAA